MIETALKAVKDLERRGASEAEGYIQNSTEWVISVREGIWNRRKKKDICIGLRTVIEKKKGFAAGTLPMCPLEDIEKASLLLSRNAVPDPSWSHLPYPKPVIAPEGIFDRNLAEISEGELMDVVETLVSAPGEKCYADCTLITRLDKTAIANTHGVEGFYEDTGIDITFSCGYGRRKATSEWHSRKLDKNVEKLATRTAEELLKMKESSRIGRTFTGEAILLPEALEYTLMACAKWAVQGENFHSRKSQFTQKGEEVLSRELTITDDGLRPEGVRSAPFDGEGNPMQRTELIRKGIFLNVLHSEYTANKYGAVSTGNAIRTATREPYIDYTNLIVKPGKHSLDSLVENVGKGILLKDFTGDVDPSSGYFNGRGEGFYIENGEIQFYCRNLHVQGNGFELLREVELVGREEECTREGVYAVPLLTSKIMVVS